MTKKIIGVLGLGIFGRTVAEELSKFEQDVIAVDCKENSVQDVAEFVSKAAVGDITDIEFLKAVGIAQCDKVVIATGTSLESSVLAIMHCKKLGVKTILAKCFMASEQPRSSLLSVIREKPFPQICSATALITSCIWKIRCL